jgi:hypothetical protein
MRQVACNGKTKYSWIVSSQMLLKSLIAAKYQAIL